MLCCPRSVSLCRMQFPGARYVPWLRRGLGAERPSWIRGHGRDLGAEGLRAPNPVSPRRSTHGQCDSGAGNPQQSSWAQGSRGSPAPHRPMESAGPGGKTACTAFLSQGALGVWFAARGEFPFAECSSQKLVLGRSCHGSSALSGRAGSGGMAGAWAQKPFAHPILHSPRRRTRGEWDLGAGDPQQSSRAQGARGGPAPLCPMERGGPGAQTACVDFLRQGTVRLWIAAGGEFPFAE